MNFWRSLNGQVTVSLTAADPGEALDAVRRAGITVHDVKSRDDALELTFLIRRQDLKYLEELARRKGYSLTLEQRKGLYWLLRQMQHRPVLVLGCLLLLVLTLWLPTRVLFIRVEGNESVSTGLILEKCSECGIRFGASRRQVRSEKTKNALLHAIPELQWTGVNTSGCVATVTVRERAPEQEKQQTAGVSGIAAARDGIITGITVTRGNALCTVGQAVRAGELLVSGYKDCGTTIQATRAEAEIYAQTRRQITAVTPTDWLQEGQITASGQKISILIGKKRINLYKGSGISGGTCDKIYSEYYLTLPGGFRLPVAIVVEQWYTFETIPLECPEEDARTLLEEFSARYLSEQMIAGQILFKWENVSGEDGLTRLQGYYACEEMIAQVRNEEIITPNGNDH